MNLYIDSGKIELMHWKVIFFFSAPSIKIFRKHMCFQCSNIYTEVSMAKDIIRKVRDKGLRYKEIASRQESSEYEVNKVIFKQYDIIVLLTVKGYVRIR